jgi:hypothetical protein
MTGDSLDAFAQEWTSFCGELHDMLIELGGEIIRDSDGVLDRDEGLRMLLRQLRHSLERDLEERDVTHPVLGPVFTDTYHTLADAPDYAAYDALISGRHTYRLRGQLGDADSLNFTTMAPRTVPRDGEAAAGPWKPWPGAGGTDTSSDGTPSAGRVITGAVDLPDLDLDDDGRFEIMLSTERPGDGVWLPMTEETNRLVVRNVYHSAFRVHQRRNPARLELECLGSDPRPRSYSTEDLRAGLAAVLRGVETIPPSRRPIFDRIRSAANGRFSSDDSFWKVSGANPRTHFQEAYWALAGDEALVIERDEMPECSSWSLGLTNAWMESLDFRFFQINLNSASARLEADGSLRIVIAREDPGHPNWLDVAGHDHGAMLWRWNDAPHRPTLPRVSSVPIETLTGGGGGMC